MGVDDNGNVKGLPDVEQACQDIENKINDSITLRPDYTLELQNNNRTIKLTVKSAFKGVVKIEGRGRGTKYVIK